MANIGYIQINRYCNNQCHFCSNPSNGNNITYERGIELIDDFIEKKYAGIIFTGGEPTLSPDLSKWIEYSTSKNIDCRIISNGMQCSNIEYVQKLKDSGLSLIHFSLYSYIPDIHDFLTNTPGSYKKLLKSIQNALKLGIRVQLNSVINKYNQNHLDKTTKFLVKNFPQINHFVWNNLDPLMMRKTDIALSTLPDFKIAGESIVKAMTFLEQTGRTFRVERLPLCFMRGFEYASTETRKIVKNEERIVHFLDNRETIRQTGNYFIHDKLPECKECDLNSICAGIYERETYYNYVKVTSQKLTLKEKQKIIDFIKGD
ncbi:MAG: radical SAM protein [Candidatus Gracilibacteria bacterium]|nr:radical SAM protein [Candidatus Gracilibacteria bacterium]